MDQEQYLNLRVSLNSIYLIKHPNFMRIFVQMHLI